jgi:hypothetical protein
MLKVLFVFLLSMLLLSCAKVSEPFKFLKREITPAEKEKPLPELFAKAERNFQKG